MLLEEEIALEVKVTCREDVDKQDGIRAGKRLLIMISMSATLTSQPRVEFPLSAIIIYNGLRSLQLGGKLRSSCKLVLWTPLIVREVLVPHLLADCLLIR
jgi:hypothetical protein